MHLEAIEYDKVDWQASVPASFVPHEVASRGLPRVQGQETME